MPSFNKVVLMGNLTRDPETKQTSVGQVVKFSIAINHKKKTESGVNEDAIFVDCTAFAKTAEIVSQWTHKGKPVLIEGRLQQEKWTAQDGSQRSKISVIVEHLTLLGQADPRQQDPQQDPHREVMNGIPEEQFDFGIPQQPLPKPQPQYQQPQPQPQYQQPQPQPQYQQPQPQPQPQTGYMSRYKAR